MNYASKKIFDIIPNVKTIWHGSDEISVWFECENVADMYFEGRIQKLSHAGKGNALCPHRM